MRLKESEAIDLKRLAIALIENAFLNAIEDEIGRPHIKRQRRALRADARAWLLYVKRDDTCSFIWCCEVLGFDPQWLRELFKEELRENKKKYYRFTKART
jgi:hypothetical protein